jgi:DNA-binding transcriptional LysR family regulator
MHDQDFRLFIALAEELHFGRAAARLGLTTPTLSKRVSDLERRIGVRLFHRSSHRVNVTTAGRALLEPARRTVESLDRFASLEAAVVAGKAGKLTAYYSPGNGSLMGRLVRQSRAMSPAVEVVFEQRLTTDIVDAIQVGDAEAGVCRDSLPAGMGHVVLRLEPRETVVVPAEHDLARKRTIGLEDLVGQTFLESDMALAHTHPGAVTEALARLVNVRVVRIHSEEEFLDRVAVGEGLCLQSGSVVARNPRRDVVGVRYVGDPIGEPMVDRLIWRIDNDDPTLRAFVAAARELVTTGSASATVEACSETR